MAKNLTAEQITDKMIRNASAATQDYKEGVQRVADNPAAKAVEKKEKMRANFLESMDDGKYEASMSQVTLQSWKTATAGKGAARWAQGMQDAKAKILATQRELKQHRDTVQQEVQSMPDDTAEQRIQRMVANARGMAQFKKRGQFI